MGDLSPWHLLIIAGVLILLFGASRLPEGARSLGRSMRILKSEIRSMHDDDDEAKKQQVDQVPAPLPPAPPVAPTYQQQPVQQPVVTPAAQPIQPQPVQPQPMQPVQQTVPADQPVPPTSS